MPDLLTLAQKHLQALCVDIPERPVGSDGNRRAAEFIRHEFQRLGWQVDSQPFIRIDWREDGAECSAGTAVFEVFPSPFSLPCRVSAPLAVASSVAELAQVKAQGKILLLYGDLAHEQLFPRNFPYVTMEDHQEIYRLVEAAQPAAVLTATGRNAQISGGQYPCPMFEDGDFDIPSAYLAEQEGARLLTYEGQILNLVIRSERRAAQGENVLARLSGTGPQRLVVCAHLDAKPGTPGALDNGTGIIILLLVAELLKGWKGGMGVELVAINGEDYFSAPGEVKLMESLDGHADEVRLAVNLDGVGYVHGHTAFSLYECPQDLAQVIRDTFHGVPGVVEGEPWQQSDHMVFAMSGIPAVAITSEAMWEMVSQVTHTPADRPELVDLHKVVRAAAAVSDLVQAIGSAGTP